MVSHLDTIYSFSQDHDVTVESDRVIGAGVGDNALGAAIVSLMPVVLEHLGIRLESDLILLGSTQSQGRGNQAGIRFFLDHLPQEVCAGICVEGMQLGRLNYFSIGTAKADITCTVRNSGEPSQGYGSESALVALNHIVSRILAIATPSRPFTRINMGRMWAGSGYDVAPDHAELGLEIVSHSDEMLDEICRQVSDVVAEIAARHGVDTNFDVFSSTRAGGIPFAHPLVQSIVAVMNELGIEPNQGHSPSELSQLIAREIPAVTLGITHGGRDRKKHPDYVLIEPILTGVAQLVGGILAIDKGACDEL